MIQQPDNMASDVSTEQYQKAKPKLQDILGGTQLATAQPTTDVTTGLRDDLNNPAANKQANAQLENTPPTTSAGNDLDVVGQIHDKYWKNVKAFDVNQAGQVVNQAFDRLRPESPEMSKAMTPYKEQLSSIANQMSELRKQQGDVTNSGEWGQLAETFGNALTQFAAGLYGAKHGIDVSGVQFNKTDWDQRIKNRIGTLENGIKDLQEQRGLVNRNMEQEQSTQKDIANRQADLGVSALKEQSQLSQQEAQNLTNAAVHVYTSAINAQREMARMQQSMGMQFAHMDQQKQEFAIKNMDQNYKQQAGQLKGLDQAIGILNGYSTGNMEDNDKTRMELNKSLATAGVDPDTLEANSQVSKLFGLYKGSDPAAGITFLKKLKSGYEEAAQQSYQAYAPIYKRVTGVDLPPEHTGKIGNKPTPVQQSVPATATPQANQQQVTRNLAPQDKQALDWANQNPNDPRAVAIKQRLGM